MDAKITKQRLSRMLSYDWLKIVAVAVALIIAWYMLFRITATRVLQSQRFVVCNYSANLAFSEDFQKEFYKIREKDVLSKEILEVEIVDMVNYAAGDTMVEARAELGDLDVMFVSQQIVPTKTETDSGEETVTSSVTQLENFLGNYRWWLYELQNENGSGYLDKMEKLLNGYYGGDYTDENKLDAQKVESEFRARVKRMKDKRYKKEEEIKAGVEIEIDRIQKYQKALTFFYAQLEAGNISLVTTTYEPQTDYEYDYAWGGTYAINICPNGETMDKLSQSVRYQTGGDSENPVVSARDMCVCFFRSVEEKNAEEIYDYEGLVYAMDLVESVLTVAE